VSRTCSPAHPVVEKNVDSQQVAKKEMHREEKKVGFFVNFGQDKLIKDVEHIECQHPHYEYKKLLKKKKRLR